VDAALRTVGNSDDCTVAKIAPGVAVETDTEDCTAETSQMRWKVSTTG
jgi:hypothetical protein